MVKISKGHPLSLKIKNLPKGFQFEKEIDYYTDIMNWRASEKEKMKLEADQINEKAEVALPSFQLLNENNTEF